MAKPENRTEPEVDGMERERRQQGPLPTDEELKRVATRILNALIADVARNRKELFRLLIAYGLSDEVLATVQN